MTAAVPKAERVRELNDRFRKAGPPGESGGRWLVTSGVRALAAHPHDVLHAVRTFAAFDADNDPHGEHDFGSFVIEGTKLFWKIDYYDRALSGGSEDPSDPEVTCRVLTIMLAAEY